MGRRVTSLIAPKAVVNLAAGGVVPAALFLVGRHNWGLTAAVALTAGWSCAWQAGRRLRGRPLSGLLSLGLLELALRTTVGLALHSARLFFLAPAIATALTGVVYIGSGPRSKPLLAVVLHDLVPSSVVNLSHPRSREMIRKLSILYGSEQILVAAISVLMILTLSTTQYVTAHLIVSWSIAATALTVAFVAFRRDLADLIPSSR